MQTRSLFLVALLLSACGGGTNNVDLGASDLAGQDLAGVDLSGEDLLDTDLATSAMCPLTSGTYIASGNTLFLTSSYLLVAQRVATILGPGGVQLQSPVLSGRGGSGEIVISAPNCMVCTVDPSKIAGGMVMADLVATNVNPILIGTSTAGGSALIVENAGGNYLYSTYNLSTKMVTHSTKIGVTPAGAASCSELMEAEGAIGDGTYDLKLLLKCSDGNTGSSPAYVATHGTFTMAPFTSTPIATTIVAWAKNSMGAGGISRMDATLGIFVAPPSQVFKLGGAADFVLDTMHPYKQCTMANTMVAAPPPL